MPDDLAGATVPLTALDPDAPFDDLEPLVDRFRAARVVAVGESAHWVREYGLLRHRLVRFLVERCGFTAFGLESGFSEGRAVDAWTRGDTHDDPAAVAEAGTTNRMGRCPELRDQLRWMRGAGLPFVGLDVPGSAVTALPALRNLRGYLAGADPAALPLVDDLVGRAGEFVREHALPAMTAYTQLPRADRDALTAGLAELAVRLDAHLPADPDAHDTARHELRLAHLLDQSLRGYAAAVLDGAPLHAAAAPRDLGMAETALRALHRLGPDARIVLGAANNHIQRIPMATPALTAPVAGTHLAARLGGAYLAVAVTAAAGVTTTRRADPDAPGGVRVVAAELPPPAEGSVEAALGGGAVADLAARRGRPAPDRIRVMDAFQPVPVAEAYDLVAVLPRISPSDTGDG